MNRIFGMLLLWAGVIGSCSAGTVEDEAGALAFMNDYVASFKHLDVRRTAKHFNEPLAVVAGSGVTVLSTQADVATWYQPLFAELANRNYGGSEWAQLRLKALSDGVVIASARAIRRRVDGSELETVGATYLLRNTSQGWRIAVISPHPASMALALE